MKNKNQQNYRSDYERKWKKIFKSYAGLVKQTINYTYKGPISFDYREELASNAWEKIVKKINQFNPKRGSLKSFIGVVTKNATIDYLKKKDPIVPHKQHYNISIEKIFHNEDDDDEFNNVQKEDILKVMSTIDEILDDFEKISFLENCMETLTSIEKKVLILKIKFNASFEDLAFQLSISEAAARSAFNRGKKKLLIELQKKIGNIF